jgi:hypothetical protein
LNSLCEFKSAHGAAEPSRARALGLTRSMPLSTFVRGQRGRIVTQIARAVPRPRLAAR